MCLQTTWTEPNVAQQDMIVYKRLYFVDTQLAKATIMGTTYTLGKLYETIMEVDNEDFAAFDGPANRAKKECTEEWISIGPGFHSAKTKKRLRNTEDEIYDGFLYECIIPAGSEYYEGLTDLVVSNKIIIVKQVEDDEDELDEA